MTFEEYKSIHFIGVGGIGVSALARLAKLMGKAVSGSDMRESVVTQGLASLGVDVKIGHALANLPPEADLVVHTEDVNESSAGFVELAEAKSRGIAVLKYSEALGLLVQGYYGVGVSGTNGKSTTTAILGLAMERAGLDPMVVLGSRLSASDESEQFHGNARFGQGKHFVFEADEYHRHMLDSRPRAAIITNIEADHLDYYRDLDDIKSAFAEFARRLPPDGLLVFNADDRATLEICKSNGTCKKISFSMKDQCAYYYLKDAAVSGQRQEFTVMARGKDLGRFSLAIPGQYNLMNALGAIAMSLELGADPDAVREAVSRFHGIWRRFETVGQYMGKPVISDYAHHPTALSGLLEATRQFYPDQKILLVFQPHQKNRTKMLFKEFVQSLRSADGIILPEIYFVPGREKEEDRDVSSRDLVDALAKQGKDSRYAPDLDQSLALAKTMAGDYGVILIAGAGTVDRLARQLAAEATAD